MSVLIAALALVTPGVSQLWGQSGEAWEPNGRLPDYSYASYHSGERAIPRVREVRNVMTDYGAVGDGVHDDTAAFQTALATMPRGGLRIPRGNYVIRDVLQIDRDGIVLLGAGSGPNGSILTFQRSLQEITGNQTPWNYGLGGLVKIGAGPAGNGGNWALDGVAANVTVAAARGATELHVSTTANVAAGDMVALKLSDTPDHSMGWHLHNYQSQPGECSWQPLPLYWPVRVASVLPGRIVLEQPLRMDVSLSWNPKVYRYSPVRESGLQNLQLRFPDHVYPGHLQESGYNALTFEGAMNCWARNVTIVNADNGPSFSGLTKNCVMKDVRLLAGVTGHHGFTFSHGAADNMLVDFVIEPVFRHGITLDHLANGNVSRRGWATDLHLDHHRDGPFSNLFTDIHAGAGSNLWSSGGSGCAGPHAGARNTYWNITSNGWSFMSPPSWVGIQSNVVPATVTQTSANGPWCEQVSGLTPEDLYQAQRRRRLN